MFHYVRGVPFEFNSGAFDNLNMWEQIDNGAQYTPTKKFLLSVPIVLFLLSTHYTHYDLAYFSINFLAVLGVVIPKLPFVRFQSFPRQFQCRKPGFREHRRVNGLWLTRSTVSSHALRSLLRNPRGMIDCR